MVVSKIAVVLTVKEYCLHKTSQKLRDYKLKHVILPKPNNKVLDKILDIFLLSWQDYLCDKLWQCDNALCFATYSLPCSEQKEPKNYTALNKNTKVFCQ